jgi:hypothetical protein
VLAEQGGPVTDRSDRSPEAPDYVDAGSFGIRSRGPIASPETDRPSQLPKERVDLDVRSLAANGVVRRFRVVAFHDLSQPGRVRRR